MTERTLVWFRGKDLRVSDHAALRDAISNGEVIPLFVIDPYFFDGKRARELPHRIQFLLESLESLRANIAHVGSRLLIAQGKSIDVVAKLAKKWNVTRVVAQRWSEPFARERDARVKAALSPIPFLLFEGETLLPPGTIRNGGGNPFSVFTAFARAHKKELLAERDSHGNFAAISPLPAPKKLPPVPHDINHDDAEIPTLASLGITRNEKLVAGGERAAKERVKHFFARTAAHYKTERDRMDHAGTSRLSQDLKFGVLTAKSVWHAADVALADHPEARDVFQNELLWREFAHHTMWDRPEILTKPFRADFSGFPYEANEKYWSAWVEGKTGYPVVDASARQLLEEGFVHNRARMISASFLTKHLLIDYKRGEAHYMKYLTDGDWAPNNMGWQWSAGSGCDAQPYFRVFNPMLQGEKFDPAGEYVKRYVPELAKLDVKYIHAPWTAPPMMLAAAGITLGKNYPAPVVDHARARDRFLKIASTALKAK